MKKLYELLNEKMKKGEKYTIISHNEFGNDLMYLYITLNDFDLIQSYRNCPDEKCNIKIYYNKDNYKILSHSSKFLIYNGFIENHGNSYTYETYNGMNVKTSKYTCFDKRYLTDIKEKNKSPIIEYYGI